MLSHQQTGSLAINQWLPYWALGTTGGTWWFSKGSALCIMRNCLISYFWFHIIIFLSLEVCTKRERITGFVHMFHYPLFILNFWENSTILYRVISNKTFFLMVFLKTKSCLRSACGLKQISSESLSETMIMNLCPNTQYLCLLANWHDLPSGFHC